jgi:Mrp family chromosome partitioning ATPase
VDVNPSNASAERRLETSQAQLLDLQSSVSQMAADAALYGSGVADVEQAVAPAEPSSPKPSRDAALGGVLARAAASAGAYWRAGTIALSHVDSTAVLGAPLLAQIPAFRRSTDGPVSNPLFDAEATEAYQFLLSSFEYALAQSGARSVLITSALPGDGKSLTALHLARALTVQGNDVVLVDSDIRTRGLTRLLRADDEPGLSGMADGLDLHNAVRRYRIVESTYLPFVPAGESPEQATGLLATGRYRRAITEILSSSELTIVDGSALLAVADASAVATQVDGVLLVLRADASSDDLLRVQERLRLISTPLIGYVVNRVADDASSSPPHGTSETNRVRRLLNSPRSDHVAEPGTRPKA